MPSSNLFSALEETATKVERVAPYASVQGDSARLLYDKIEFLSRGEKKRNSSPSLHDGRSILHYNRPVIEYYPASKPVYRLDLEDFLRHPFQRKVPSWLVLLVANLPPEKLLYTCRAIMVSLYCCHAQRLLFSPAEYGRFMCL